MSDIIETLMEDHERILEFISTFEQRLMELMEHNIFDYTAYQQSIQFIREFADVTHHQREEKILFKYMIEHIGEMAKNLVHYGMNAEHDLGRLYVSELDKAINIYNTQPSVACKLSILTYGGAYCELLKRHIEKENKVVYPLAKRKLSVELFNQMASEQEQYYKKL